MSHKPAGTQGPVGRIPRLHKDPGTCPKLRSPKSRMPAPPATPGAHPGPGQETPSSPLCSCPEGGDLTPRTQVTPQVFWSSGEQAGKCAKVSFATLYKGRSDPPLQHVICSLSVYPILLHLQKARGADEHTQVTRTHGAREQRCSLPSWAHRTPHSHLLPQPCTRPVCARDGAGCQR